jgi:hypothetical protein
MWNFKGFNFNFKFGKGNKDKYKDGNDNEANKKKKPNEDLDDMIGKKEGTNMAEDFLSKFHKRDYIQDNHKQISKNQKKGKPVQKGAPISNNANQDESSSSSSDEQPTIRKENNRSKNVSTGEPSVNDGSHSNTPRFKKGRRSP